MLTIEVAGERLALLPERAAFVPSHATLLIADLHLGKAHAFRRLGVPVPEGGAAAALATLDRLICTLAARRLVFLGDLLHSASAQDESTMHALSAWRGAHRDVEITLVRGNHDRHAGDPPAGLDINVVDEPLSLGPFLLCHHPDPRPGGHVLAGHWHPCVAIAGRGRDRLRLPCFWVREGVTILPAFGSFTGMHPIDAEPAARVYAISDEAVTLLPVLPVLAGGRS
jgi:DNA ligase-associated metallophosphoesterase